MTQNPHDEKNFYKNPVQQETTPNKTLSESFNWLSSDVLDAGAKGEKRLFKSVVLMPTISGNKKKYIAEELIKSARTLTGRAVDLNHVTEKVRGNVDWAECDEKDNFKIECVWQVDSKYKALAANVFDFATMQRPAYLAKYPAAEQIKGLSVKANYRFHKETDGSLEPHGIIFDRLSIVQGSEVCGVDGTTISLAETKTGDKALMETLERDAPIDTAPTITEGGQSQATEENKTVHFDNTKPLSYTEMETIIKTLPEGPAKRCIDTLNREYIKFVEKTTREAKPITEQIDKLTQEAKQTNETLAATQKTLKETQSQVNVLTGAKEALEKQLAQSDAKAQNMISETQSKTAEKLSLAETALKENLDLKKRNSELEEKNEALKLKIPPNFRVGVGTVRNVENKDKLHVQLNRNPHEN